MRHKDFNMKEHGFVGHLAEPDDGSDRAVIVIMGGEQSLLPGIKFAERFADYGITGHEDEAWPAEYSVREIEKNLKDAGYDKDVKVIVYPHGSHLNGLMPNKNREKRLYWMIPLIGLMYKTFGKYRKKNLRYLEESEKEICAWLVSG